MQVSHEAFAAALVQWKPLIEKVSFKAAKRAAGMKDLSMGVDDFRQELSMTLLRAMESFDPDRNVKFITFLYRSFFNEVNKLLYRSDCNAKVAPTYSGDSFYSDEGGESAAAWDIIEDDSERSAEHLVMDAELTEYVRERLEPRTRAMFDALSCQDQIVTQQLAAYNSGVELEAQEGGIRRFHLDLNLPFVCRLFGVSKAHAAKMGKEIQEVVSTYGDY